MAIGAPKWNGGKGCVYVYSLGLNGYEYQAKLTASDGVNLDLFGSALSLTTDGSKLAIGACGKDTSRGNVYIFTRNGNTWTQQSKIAQISTRNANDAFGYSVALSGDGSRLIIGVLGRNTVHLFINVGGNYTYSTYFSHGNAKALGYAVEISEDGNTVVAGGNGPVVVIAKYTGSVWIIELIWGPTPPYSYGIFGRALSMSSTGDVIAIGDTDYSQTSNDTNLGVVYVYNKTATAYTLTARLKHPAESVGRYFGQKVSLSNDGTKLSATQLHNDGLSLIKSKMAGVVYANDGSGWKDQMIISIDDLDAPYYSSWNNMKHFSTAMAPNGNFVLMGYHKEDIGSALEAGRLINFPLMPII